MNLTIKLKAAKDPSVRQLKRKLEAAPDNVKTQIANLLKDVATDSGTVGKGA